MEQGGTVFDITSVSKDFQFQKILGESFIVTSKDQPTKFLREELERYGVRDPDLPLDRIVNYDWITDSLRQKKLQKKSKYKILKRALAASSASLSDGTESEDQSFGNRPSAEEPAKRKAPVMDRMVLKKFQPTGFQVQDQTIVLSRSQLYTFRQGEYDGTRELWDLGFQGQKPPEKFEVPLTKDVKNPEEVALEEVEEEEGNRWADHFFGLGQ